MEYGTFSTHTTTISLADYRERYQDIERFAACCRQCNNYGQQWVCPPFDFDVRAALDRYDEIHIVGYKVMLAPELTSREYTPEERRLLYGKIMKWARRTTDAELLRLEAERPGSRAFFPGSCQLCGEGRCTRLEGKPCIHSELTRNSLENFGFDLCKTAEELLGIPMVWSRGNGLAEYFLLVGGLCY
ncbi:MAG: DUF2284 domain-containing protein [Porphyromonas sp.]|nr:DUF2284 domain-containing protein [Porphyromonas sp.]